MESSDATENSKGSTPTSKVDTCSKIEVLSASKNSSEELVCCGDMALVDIPASSDAATESISMPLHIVGDMKNLESDSECSLDRSCLVASLECESNRKKEGTVSLML